MENYLKISEVADRLHKSEQSIVRWLKVGKLPYTQVSERRRLICESDLVDFLNNRKVCPPPKRIDKCGTVIANSPNSSLKTEYGQAEVDVRSLRKEISRLCQSN